MPNISQDLQKVEQYVAYLRHLIDSGAGGGGTATTDASLLTSGTIADVRLSANVALKTYVDSGDATNSTAISTETTNRQNADTGLQTKISALTLTPTPVKTASYTAVAGDLVRTDATSGNVTITLPPTPADKIKIAVKMIGTSGSNTTIINTSTTDVFNKTGGVTTATLTLLNQAITLQYDAAAGIWGVISSDTPLSGLDGRFAGKTGAADITITDPTKGFVITTPTGEHIRITGYKDSNGQPQLNITLF